MAAPHDTRTRAKKGVGSSASRGGSPPVVADAVADALRNRGLHEWAIPLKNITCTEHCRPTNPSSVQDLVTRIRQVGWMPTALPQVTVPGIPEGEEMTDELAQTLEVFVLDGNHRIKAAQQVYANEPDKTIRCSCYRDFACTFTKKIISDACNLVQETHAKRTTYDQVFFFSTMITEVERQWGADSRRKKEVKCADLKACWKRVGSPPSDSSLRQWLEVIRSCSSEALLSLRTMTEKGVPGFDRITKNFLHDSLFRQLTPEPRKQALVLEIVARYPKSGAGKVDLKPVLRQAEDVAKWIRGVELIVPREQWSTGLTDVVNKFAIDEPGHYANYIKPHQQYVDTDLQKLQKGLPAHAPELDDADADIIRAKPLPQIRTALKSDASLRPFLDAYDKRYEDTKNTVNALKLQIVPPALPRAANGKRGGKGKGKDKGDGVGDDDDDDTSDDDDGDTFVPCVFCRVPETTRYVCVICGAHHAGDCKGATVIGVDERDPARKCIDCGETRGKTSNKRKGKSTGDDDEAGLSSSSGKGAGKEKGKRSKTGATPGSPKKIPKLPSATGLEGDLKIERRAENTCLHELTPLSADFPEKDIYTIKVQRHAMLVFVSLSHNNQEHLLQDNTASSHHLKRLLYHVCKEVMHPKGTVIVSLPVPFYEHCGRIAEYLKQSGLGLVVEDTGLVVEYGSRGGGLTAEYKKKHLAGSIDFYLIAHHSTVNKDGGSDFKCNMQVTPQNFPGRATATQPATSASGTPRTAQALMYDVPYRGSTRAFHNNVASFGIQRFTSQGDTVVTFSAETDGVIECALHYGRRLEVFVAVRDKAEDVANRMEEAWEAPWREGKFTRNSSNSNFKYIAPGSLPEGISLDTTPKRVAANAGAAKSPEQLLEFTKELACTFGWQIKTSAGDNLVCLHAADGVHYKQGSKDIPIWGSTVIFNTPQDALQSLDPEKDELSLQFVRLVLVADYHLLQTLCVHGKEGVRSTEAGLYIKVSPTCPAYYAMWDDSTEETSHEVASYLGRNEKRTAWMDAFNDPSGKTPAPVKLKVCNTIQGSGNGTVVKVRPGVSVVRSGWCGEGGTGALDAGGGGGEAQQVDIPGDAVSAVE